MERVKERIRASLQEVYHPGSFGRENRNKEMSRPPFPFFLRKNPDKLSAQPSNSRKFPATGETEQASCMPPTAEEGRASPGHLLLKSQNTGDREKGF